MAIGKNGDVAVCDYGNNRIQIFDAKGDCVTTYGAPSAGVARMHKFIVCCSVLQRDVWCLHCRCRECVQTCSVLQRVAA